MIKTGGILPPLGLNMKRRSGILMPIFSLPNQYGIGDFGSSAYNFINYLKKAGQRLWQVLPLVQTGYGDSPYSSVCSYSFNPYFISPELLYKQGLLTKEELSFVKKDSKRVNYADLYSVRYPMLRKAFGRFYRGDEKFINFVKEKKYYNYALFMALKFASGQKHFYEWEERFKYRDKKALTSFAKSYEEELLFWQFVQYTAKTQWLELKEYANQQGIEIIGDLPLYVALDSVDVWENPELYKLDENLLPKKVAGVPPDYFCEDGQLWGNPVYDYAVHQQKNFTWWSNRLKKALEVYDYIRIDHFRGLDRYFEVPSDAENARQGEWIDVPSEELFGAIHKRINKKRIIAEDLGIIDDGVRELLSKVGYPGMKILSFAFNGEENNLYLPQHINNNAVCYTGTHDNDTLMGLISTLNEWDYNNLINGVKRSLEIFDIKGDIHSHQGIANALIELGMACKADTFILPMQDLLLKGGEYRINKPGIVGDFNWSIRFEKGDFTLSSAKKLKNLCGKYKRN